LPVSILMPPHPLTITQQGHILFQRRRHRRWRKQLAWLTNANAGNHYPVEQKLKGKEVRNNKVEKTATIGVDGVKKIIFNAYIVFSGKFNKTFDNEIMVKKLSNAGQAATGLYL
jgi:hypothetical protein